MGKKTESKLEKLAIRIMEEEKREVESELCKFYPNGTIANISPSSEEQPLASLLQQAKNPPSPQALTQEQMKEVCLQIRSYVLQGKPSNAECQLHKGRQLSDRHEFPLGNTVVKILPMDTFEPKYLFIKAGDILNASVFLGGDNAAGIMVIQDENGNDYFLRLSEFHLLSLREHPDPHKEIGLITSYVWLTAKVYSSILFSYSLDPIKNLLLSDRLQSEWQRAKDAASKSANEVEGGESNG